jgi:hypothetical protein
MGEQAMQSLLNKEALAAMERKKSELESQSRTEAASAAVAFAIQNDALRQVRKLINSLESLLTQITSLGNGFADLKTNDTGRAVAQNRDLVAAMHHLYEKDMQTLASSGEIAARLTDVRRLEVVLVESLGSRDKPESAFIAQITNGMAWATIQATNAHRIQLMLKTLTREAKIAAVPGASQPQDMTLENAMEEFELERALAELKHLVAGLAVAKPASSSNLTLKPETSASVLPSLDNRTPASEYSWVSSHRWVDGIGVRRNTPSNQTSAASTMTYHYPPGTINAAQINYQSQKQLQLYCPPELFNPSQAYYQTCSQPQLLNFPQAYYQTYSQPQLGHPSPRSYSFPGGAFKLFQIYYYKKDSQ